MSTIIKFDIKELKELVHDKDSCVVEKKVVQNVALQPWCLGNLKEALKNVLDYKIGKFDKDYDGILLAYKNVRILQNIGTIKNDSAEITFQVQADYFIFSPYVGAVLKGVVNRKTFTHLGVLVHRVFNVVIPRPTEEPGAKWLGSGVEEGQTVAFRIVVMDLFGALPYIRGELDERLLKAGAEEDHGESTTNDPLKVNYVHFGKTKPRQNGESAQISPDRSTIYTYVDDVRPKTPPPASRKKESTVVDRSKNRRQNYDDTKQLPRQGKKHRKD